MEIWTCLCECGLVLGLGKAGASEEGFVELDEDSFAACEGGSVVSEDLGLVEELASVAVGVAADERERMVERYGAEVIDLHVARDGEDVERAVELAHRLVEKCGDEAAVDVAGWAFVKLLELNVRCRDGESGD